MDSSPSIHRIDDMNSSTLSKSRSMESLMNAPSTALKYNSSVEEVHVSPVVSRRGYLNFLEENGTGWVKKYVVCRILKEENPRKRFHLTRLFDVHLHLYIITKKILLNEH